MADFVALYRGPTVAQADLVAVSAEPRLVRRFFTELLGEPADESNEEAARQSAVRLEVVQDD